VTAGDAAPLFRIERRGAIAVARLACGKGNALNPRSLAAIEAALEAAVGTAARGVVLAGDGRFFSAGLDLVSLYDVERRAMDGFMRLFDRVMLRVFAFPRPVVAAVDGHAVAGGAILALACDERVMGEGDGRFGLNEIRLGVPFPASALEIVRYAVPPAAAERALYRGELVEPREALARGLVTAVSGGDVVADAVERCERLAEQPSEAFSTIKAALKEPAVERARVTMDPLRRTFVEAWYGPDARRLIGEVRVRLGGA
jgi:enoyl-CoA hydratase